MIAFIIHLTCRGSFHLTATLPSCLQHTSSHSASARCLAGIILKSYLHAIVSPLVFQATIFLNPSKTPSPPPPPQQQLCCCEQLTFNLALILSSSSSSTSSSSVSTLHSSCLSNVLPVFVEIATLQDLHCHARGIKSQLHRAVLCSSASVSAAAVLLPATTSCTPGTSVPVLPLSPPQHTPSPALPPLPPLHES